MDASTTRSEDVDLQHVETREGQEFAAHVPDWANKAKRGSVDIDARLRAESVSEANVDLNEPDWKRELRLKKDSDLDVVVVQSDGSGVDEVDVI